MSIAGLLAALSLLYWLLMLADVIKGMRHLHTLPRAQEPLEKPPLVSVIVAAKEEEGTILETVRHLLSQDYPRLEIIAINDRSQDTTGLKLDELRKWSEQKSGIHTPLQIIHITHLPEGWLGKNHALYQGYLQAKGQYLLFTDADVLFTPSVITDAISYIKKHEVQHLTLSPDMVTSSLLLRGFVRFFLFSFSMFVRPWRANLDHHIKHGMGIGAFNLVSRQAYEAIGTHKAIALRPDDDLQLGIQIKRALFRQRVLAGNQAIQVEWYHSLKEAVRGLEKNIFSGFHYSLPLAFMGCVGQLLCFIMPWIGMLLFWDSRGLLYALSVILEISLYTMTVRALLGKAGKEIVLLPVSAALLVYVIARSVYKTLQQQGIYWRGTFYSLQELKRKQP
jgi:cellulose synthase/poly-beta-1,6-N-acetylglucosamine synthase-like glycosyltransferase